MTRTSAAFCNDIVLRSYPKPVSVYEGLAQIECENLPVVYDCISLDDGQIVLEEYIDGVTISALMETEKYRYKGAKAVLKGLCNALSAVHSLNFVHRDIKPENVMVDSLGRVYLIDFNVSRKVTDASRDTVIMGTVGYASPEQLGISLSSAR